MTFRAQRSSSPASPRSARQRGLSLVELMIAMVIGLVVVASASAIFISNRQTYRATESLGRVQESTRVAFELMARDIREAGGNPCGRNLPVANVINNSGTNWWSNWGDGIIGYDGADAAPGLAFGAAVGQRVTGTDAIELKSGDNATGVTVVQHVATSAQFKLNTINHSLDDSDIAMVCDFRQASIFQITNAQPGTNEVIVHNIGATASPGNCSKGLGFPTVCTTNGNDYEYGPNSTVVRLHAVRWYIGRGADGRNSLFRSNLINNAGVVTPVAQEIVDGVNNLTLQYLFSNGTVYQDASAIPANRWRDVAAVRLVLELESVDRSSTTANQGLRRTLTHTVSLRNRLP